MLRSRIHTTAAVLFVLGIFSCLGRASAQTVADEIGATALQAINPTLTGSGIDIIQAEADNGPTNCFEVNPSSVSLPPSIFTYINSTGTIATANFPNSVGTESSHADGVASIIAGIAPGLSGIDNYDASYYVNNVIGPGVTPASINAALHNAPIVNQSWAYEGTSVPAWDQPFDQYAEQNNVLFINAAGNPDTPGSNGTPMSPSTMYNGICVNATGVATKGPTADGRSKPDLIAPAGETSFAAPVVTGAATILLQAANNNAGGPNTAAAAGDIRTMKALLLNGATKPAGWSHTSTAPLDPYWGSGIVNVYQSYQELAAGRQTVSVASTAGTSQISAPANLVLSSGWDLGSLSSASVANHYFFTAPSTGAATDSLTATIAWDAEQWDSSGNAIINNLFLALYDTTDTTSSVAISDSMVDNVQQIDASGLVPGRTYDLEVYEPAAVVNNGAETYGIAYSVVPEPSTLLLLAALSVCGIAAFLRRKRAAA